MDLPDPLIPASESGPPAPLLWRDTMPARLLEAHDAQAHLPSVRPVAVEGAVYAGQGLFAEPGGGLRHGVHEPSYVGFLLTWRSPESNLVRRWTRGLRKQAGVRVRHHPGPALAPLAPNWIWGHVLLEALPKLALLHEAAPADWPLVLPTLEGHWLPRIAAEVAPGRPLLRFDPRSEGVTAEPLVTCTEVTPEGALRAEAGPLMRRLAARLGAARHDRPRPDGPRVYLSRSRLSKTNHRILNEVEVEAALAAEGFVVIHPQEMTLAEQARALDGAQAVVGEYSSALHDAVFAPSGATVVGINWTNGYQSWVARVAGHRLGFVPPAEGRFRMGTMTTGKEAFEVDLAPLLLRLREAGVA